VIEKMKFLTITGPKNDIDRVLNDYLSKYEIHLENALSELSTVKNLKPFVEINPYKDSLSKSKVLLKKLKKESTPSTRSLSPDEANNIINNASSIVEEFSQKKKNLKEEKKHLEELLEQIEPYRLLDYDLHTILDFKFIKFRFGRISHEYFNKFSTFVYDNINTFFYESDSDEHYVWGIYFVPVSSAVKVDAIFASLHFERIFLSDEYEGTPEEAYQTILSKIKEIEKENKNLSGQINDSLSDIHSDLLLAHNTLDELTSNYDVRRLAACTKEKEAKQVFYIICGWMGQTDAKSFLSEIKNDSAVYCLCDDDNEEYLTKKPPTKLRNPKLFKPFELFINMYGLPAYNEMDPTIFVALTYTLIFGIMFGDVGQGISLFIGGRLLFKFKKMNIAGIISLAGIWSTIFGFLYGSVFGFEEVIHALWRRPMENIMSTLIVSIVFGVVLIIIAMIINIINGIRAKNIKKTFFGASGITGLICYGSATISIGLLLTGHPVPGTIILFIIVGIPLLAIFMKDPLTRFIEKKSTIFPPGSKVMFFVEATVELFDVVLSYATNTISFVRIGAFSLSHAGMMGVVLTLADVANGTPNLLVLIIGNIVVIGLEGLVVGIQVLRLEYYEMFSRFYSGTGKKFKPYK
jgi:V/A-type H+/Na+-transporting ATPase subunit I